MAVSVEVESEKLMGVGSKSSLVSVMMAVLFLVAEVPEKKEKEGEGSSASSSSWALFRRIVSSCKFDGGEVKEARVGCLTSASASQMQGKTRVMHKGEISPETSSASASASASTHSSGRSVSSYGCKPPEPSPQPASFRGMQLKRWSGCYECHMIVDPIEAFSRDSFRTIVACPSCGQIFTKTDALELHQITKHAVSELSEEDSARNVVEIIFQSSWLKKENPICKIERILKVHNTQKTINKFEEYRDMVKAKANKVAKKHARCIADGNELLRFHCTTYACSLGMNGSSSLCTLASCNICNIIKNGFSASPKPEIYTTASSGRAHDSIASSCEKEKRGGRRAMVVCRVIAGRVQRKEKDTIDDPAPSASASVIVADDDFVSGGFDSVAGHTGIYSNLDDLFVYNPKAVLPCFVVIYKTLQG